jgi:hypothetical protein
MQAAAAAGALWALQGCGREQGEAAAVRPTTAISGPRTEADTRVDQVATGEPGRDRRQWRATSDTARLVTGNLTASQPEGPGGPVVLAFANGVTAHLSVIGLRTGRDQTGGLGGDFARTLGSESDAGVYVYRVIRERVDRTASRGGLCGGVRATHVVISEYVAAEGDWRLKLAAFRGSGAPGPEAVADPELCATYAFQLG